MTDRTSASPLQAGLLLMVVMVLVMFVGGYVQQRNVVAGLLVTEWLLIGLPVAALVLFGRLHPRIALALRRPSGSVLLGVLLAGLCGWYLVAVVVELVQQPIFPIPNEVAERFQAMVVAPERPLWLDLMAFALSPAVCEELLFRGIFLIATQRVLSAGWAIALNAVLFALFHLNPYRLLPTFLLGMVLALLVWRSRSILAGMLFHVLNNGAAVVVARIIGATANGSKPIGAPTLSPSAIAVSLVCFAFGMWLAVGVREGADATTSPAGPADL